MATYWLIDGAYVYSCILKERDRLKDTQFSIDYKKLRTVIERKNGEEVVAYYFNCTPNPPTDAQNAFHTWLKSAKPHGPHIRVKLYKLKEVHLSCPYCNNGISKKTQKGVDVGIVTTALRYANNFDTLILSTGDGDFEETVRHLKEDLQKKIILASFKYGLSTDLQQYADEVWFIDDFITEVQDTRFTSPFDDPDITIE